MSVWGYGVGFLLWFKVHNRTVLHSPSLFLRSGQRKFISVFVFWSTHSDTVAVKRPEWPEWPASTPDPQNDATDALQTGFFVYTVKRLLGRTLPPKRARTLLQAKSVYEPNLSGPTLKTNAQLRTDPIAPPKT